VEPQQQQTTAQKLTRARLQMVLGQPFFSTLALRLKLVPGSLPTMATDGSRIVYNPAFVSQLKPAEVEGTLAHTVGDFLTVLCLYRLRIRPCRESPDSCEGVSP
jgi:predicted metal-dependent peptidase